MQRIEPGRHEPAGQAGGQTSPAWILLAMAGILVLVAAVGAAIVLTRDDSRPAHVAVPAPIEESPDPAPSVSTTSCAYQPDGDVPDGISAPATPPARAAAGGPVHVRLDTSRGTVQLDLEPAAAPCTVNSFLSLARQGFYADTGCHRLTTSEIYVLQCGDPSGTGQGGPGYKFGDENLPTRAKTPYPRGTVAMANGGPGTNGSQFFLVYRDSEIDPNYSVFGTVTAGLDVLEKVAAGGTDNANGAGDGHPKLDVTIKKITWWS